MADDTPEDMVRRRFNEPESHLVETREFLAGKLHIIRVGSPTSSNPWSAVVYDDGRTKRVFANATELGTYISDRGIGTKSIKSDIFTIPGMIAIAMAATVIIVILVGLFHDDKEIRVPETLGSALATILGFYFGRYTAGAPHGAGEGSGGIGPNRQDS
jgi:hypothetical protein